MGSEDQLTSHRHTFDMTIVPVCDVCGLPLTEVLQITQEENAEMQQHLAQARARANLLYTELEALYQGGMIAIPSREEVCALLAQQRGTSNGRS